MSEPEIEYRATRPAPVAQRMIVGTLSTGFYAIRPGNPERCSPVYRKRSDALGWLARFNREGGIESP